MVTGLYNNHGMEYNINVTNTTTSNNIDDDAISNNSARSTT